MVQQLNTGDNNQFRETSSKGQNNPFDSNYTTERQETINWLRENKYPPLPVAPAIDPYKHHLVSKEKKTDVKYCPLTSELKPVPLYTGKNPSYLDRDGKPHLLNHRKYQNQLPTEQECHNWFANPEINHVKPIQIHHVRSFQSAQKDLNYVVAPISPNPSLLLEKYEQSQLQSSYAFSSKVCPLVSNFPKTWDSSLFV